MVAWKQKRNTSKEDFKNMLHQNEQKTKLKKQWVWFSGHKTVNFRKHKKPP